MGEKCVTCLFQRTAAGQIIIKRFAILRVLLLIVRGKRAELFCNEVAVSFKTFQQQRCAKLRHGTYTSAVKAAVGHKLKRFACRAIKYRQFKDIAQLIGYNHFQPEFLCQFGKACGGFLPVQEKKYISPIHKGMRVRGSFVKFIL